jgi:hypothetical protein
VRAWVRRFDALLRRIERVYEFADDRECLFRLQLVKAAQAKRLAGESIAEGDPLLALHLWNEHLPELPAQGADLAWAARFYRLLVRSFRLVAAEMERDSALERVRAIRCVTLLVFLGDPSDAERLMRRLGFAIEPYRNALGRFGEFWENLYTWAIMWAYNPVSLRGRSLWRARRTELWMSRSDFLQRYGRKP